MQLLVALILIYSKFQQKAFEISDYFINWITMTRKSSKHCMQHTKRLDSCFNLFRSHQQYIHHDLPHWRSNQQPQNAEAKLYHWATGPHYTQAPSNLLVMVNAQLIKRYIRLFIYLFIWDIISSSCSVSLFIYH